jgi:predicted CxxxxCH...CXXCH cytochrome family protein
MILPLLVGCLKAEPAPVSCSGCHSSPGETPFVALGGIADPTHDAHLAPGLTDPIGCGECHHVPATVDEDGHLGPVPADVTFAEGTRYPADDGWDEASETCTVGCHDQGGADPDPGWYDDVALSCGSCHGNPPGGGHPKVDPGSCAQSGCHPHVGSGPDHVNGAVDFQ